MGNIMDDWFGFDQPKPPKLPDPGRVALSQMAYNDYTSQRQQEYNTQQAQQQQQYIQQQVAQQQQIYEQQAAAQQAALLEQARVQHEYNLQLAEEQAKYNQQAQQANLAANRIDQSTPFMNVNYEQTGSDQYGNPTYTAKTTYTPEQQALLEQLQISQQGLGQFGQTLVDDLSRNPIYNQGVPDFTDMANPLMQRHLAIMNPYFEQQFNKLDSDLRNQGLTPGTPAYDNAVRTLRQTQSESTGQFANQSIQSVMAQYAQPFDVIKSIMGASMPMSMPNLGLQSPTQVALQAPNIAGVNVGVPNINAPVVGAPNVGGVQVAPVNFAGITQANLDAQMKQYEAQYKQYADSINAIGGIMGTVLGAPSGTLIGNAVGGLGSGLAGLLGISTTGSSGGVLPLFRSPSPVRV